MAQHRRIYSEKEKKSKQKLANIICFIIAALFSLIFISQVSLRYVVKTNDVAKHVNNIDYSKITVVNGEEKLPLTEYINKYYVSDPTVTDDDIETLLENSTASDYIAVKITEFSQYILGGSYEIPEITPDEIAEEVDLSRDMIYETSPIRFLPDNHATLKAQLKGPLQSFNASISESRTIAGFKAFISVAFTIFIAVLFLIDIVVWTIVTARLSEKTAYAIRLIGISIMAGSAAALLLSLVFSLSPQMLTSKLKAVDINEYVGEAFLHCVFIACIPLLVGFFITLGSILYIVRHKQSYIDLENSTSINYETVDTASELDEVDEEDNTGFSDSENIVDDDKNEVAEEDTFKFQIDSNNYESESKNDNKNIPKAEAKPVPEVKKVSENREQTVDELIDGINKDKESKIEQANVYEENVQKEIDNIKKQLTGGKHSDGATEISDEEIRKIAEAKVSAEEISNEDEKNTGNIADKTTTQKIIKNTDNSTLAEDKPLLQEKTPTEHIPTSHAAQETTPTAKVADTQTLSKTATIKLPIVKPDGTVEDVDTPVLNNASVPTNGRICPKCGKMNLSRNLFCSECGAMLE